MAGIESISALAIHKTELESPRTLPIRPLIAATIPSIPAAIASRDAISPRLRHPRRSTGSDATTKKIAGAIKGIIMCLVLFFKSGA